MRSTISIASLNESSSDWKKFSRFLGKDVLVRGPGNWRHLKRPDFHCLAHLSATILQYNSNSFVIIRLDAMGARMYVVIAQNWLKIESDIR